MSMVAGPEQAQCVAREQEAPAPPGQLLSPSDQRHWQPKQSRHQEAAVDATSRELAWQAHAGPQLL